MICGPDEESKKIFLKNVCDYYYSVNLCLCRETTWKLLSPSLAMLDLGGTSTNIQTDFVKFVL